MQYIGTKTLTKFWHIDGIQIQNYPLLKSRLQNTSNLNITTMSNTGIWNNSGGGNDLSENCFKLNYLGIN